MLKLISAPLCALLLAAPALCDVIDVGGGANHFSEIQGAVNAAQDGDVLRIYPGNYEPFVVTNKDLTLARVGGNVLIVGSYRVRNLSSDRTVEISGLSATGTDNSALIISDCAGSVRVRDAVLRGANYHTLGYPYAGERGVRVLDSLDVAFSRCTISGGDPSTAEDGGPGSVALESIGSTLSLYACSITGSFGSTDDDPGASGYGGGHAVAAYGSGRVWIEGCTLVAGSGGNADWDLDWITGMYGCGGYGGDAYNGSTPVWIVDSNLIPGYGGDSPGPCNGSNGNTAPASARYRSGVAHELLSLDALLQEGQPMQLRFHGAPGDVVLLGMARDADLHQHVFSGPLLIKRPGSPDAMPWRLMGQIGSNGLLLTDITAPELPLLGHQTLHLQGRYLDGARNPLGSSTWVTVLDSAW